VIHVFATREGLEEGFSAGSLTYTTGTERIVFTWPKRTKIHTLFQCHISIFGGKEQRRGIIPRPNSKYGLQTPPTIPHSKSLASGYMIFSFDCFLCFHHCHRLVLVALGLRVVQCPSVRESAESLLARRFAT